MPRLTKCLIMFCILFLVSCSDSETSHTDSKKTVIDDQLHALEKAKTVEKQLLDSTAKQKEQIDAH